MRSSGPCVFGAVRSSGLRGPAQRDVEERGVVPFVHHPKPSPAEADGVMLELAHRASGADHGARIVLGGGSQVAPPLVARRLRQGAGDNLHRCARSDAASAGDADNTVLQLVLPTTHVAPVDAAAGEEAEEAQGACAVRVAAGFHHGHAVVDHWPARAGQQRVPRGDVVAAAAAGRASDDAVFDLQRQARGSGADEEMQDHGSSGSRVFGRWCPAQILAKFRNFVNDSMVCYDRWAPKEVAWIFFLSG